MVIFRNNKVYVGIIDISFIRSCPNIEKMPSRSVIASHSKYISSYYIYKDEKTINYFKNSDFVINYDVYKDLTFEELTDKIEITKKISNSLIEKINSECQKDNELVLYRNKLEHIIFSLEELVKIKKGLICLNIPEEIQYYEGKTEINFFIEDIHMEISEDKAFLKEKAKMKRKRKKNA